LTDQKTEVIVTQYIIYRSGSNSANQPLCNLTVVCQVEAKSQTTAIKTAKKDYSISVYANQSLEAVPASRCSKSDCQSAWEETCRLDQGASGASDN
jgi:hypothetical protein